MENWRVDVLLILMRISCGRYWKCPPNKCSAKTIWWPQATTLMLLEVASCSRQRLCAKGHLDRWEAVRLAPETSSKKWWQVVTRKSSWVHWVNRQEWQKVMIFVAIVEGKIPLVHAFIDERGGKIPVNGDCYLKLLQDRVWPLFQSYATQRNLWWMKDGAPLHCTNMAKSFLKEKFRGWVISRGTEFVWPAHSPDLNPLNFHFWAAAQKQVYLQKLESIGELVECVISFLRPMTRRRSGGWLWMLLSEQGCADGGYFQHLL